MLFQVAAAFGQQAPAAAGPESGAPQIPLSEFVGQTPGMTNVVRVRGVVTGYSPTLEQVFLQDGESGLVVETSGIEGASVLEPGRLIEVKGKGVRRWAGARIVAESFQDLGAAELPAPAALTGEALSDLGFNGRRVEVRGLVTEVQEQMNRLYLNLRVGERRVVVYLTRYNWMDERLRRLQDSIVRVTGALSLRIQRRNRVARVFLIASDTDDLIFEQIAPEDPYVIDESPIGGLLALGKDEAPVRRVRIRGRYARRDAPQTALIEQDGESIRAVFRGPY